MKDDVPEKVKVQRLREMMDLYYGCLPQVQEKFLGHIQLVLVEKVRILLAIVKTIATKT